MKKGLLILAVLLCSITIFAQEETTVAKENKWKISGTPGMNISQNFFSNWLSGGADMTALAFDSKVYANYKHERFSLENSLNLGYGLNHQKEQGMRKNIDKIDLLSKFIVAGSNAKFRYSASLNFKSQFTDGYDYRSTTQWLFTSTFLAPGYLTGSVGVDYIGTKNLVVQFSPLAEKSTMIREAYYDKKVVNTYWGGYEPRFRNDEEAEFQNDYEPSQEELDQVEARLDSTTSAYGLEWRENSLFETGMLVQLTYANPELMKNIGLKSRLDIFSAYSNFAKPDIDWEVWLSFKFNKSISFNINTQMIYDNDIKFQETENGIVTNKSKIQLRNFMGIGVSYTFEN